ncbi:MAG TPA: response regulator [candidate division Zixibacteria bacterium]|nr:response regulator [candidate division Zixibacteria bacterium]
MRHLDERIVELRQQASTLVRLALGDLDQLARSILIVASSALQADRAVLHITDAKYDIDRLWHYGLSEAEAEKVDSFRLVLRGLPLLGGTSLLELSQADHEAFHRLETIGISDKILTTHMIGPSAGLDGLLVLSRDDKTVEYDEIDLVVLDVLSSISAGALVNCLQQNQLTDLVNSQKDLVSTSRARSEQLQRELLERRRIEQELQQAAAFARYNPSPVMRTDRSGMVLDANPQAKRVFGDDPVGQSLYDIFVHLNRNRIERLTENERYQFEHLIGTATFLFTVRLDVVSDSFLLFGTEITDRKIAERVLQAQEERSRKLLDTVQAGLAVVDMTSHEIIEANRLGIQLLGGQKNIIVGSPYSKHFGRLDGLDIAMGAQGKDAQPVEAFLIDLNGRETPILLTVTSVDFSSEIFLLLSFVDITNLKRAEEIKASQFKIFQAAVTTTNMEELLGTIHQILYTLMDAANLYIALYDNESGLYSFPYCVDEYDPVGPDPVDLTGSLTEYVRRTAQPVLVNEESMKRLKESGEITQVGQASPIWLGAPLTVSDEVIGVIAVQDYHDPERYTHADMEILSFVSGNVAMAIERLRSQQQQHRLEEKLLKAEKMESLGMLAGGVAHDLNNMLGPLVGYPELILRKLEKDNPIRKQIERIQRSAVDAAEVIQDLLTLARRGRYEMKSLNLNEVVENYLDSPSYLKLSEQRNEVRLENSLDPAIGLINGSAPHLAKVVMNLIVNAYDAMPDGGNLRVSTSVEHLSKAAGVSEQIEPGDYVVLRVKDTGSGIPEDAIGKIFEPYFSKKAMGASGSGIGLAVVYGILKDHHGSYDIISEVDVGTEFVLYFPLTEMPRQAEKADDDIQGGDETILIVDDVEEVREMACALLEMLGYITVPMENGHKALDYLKNNKVDLVVLDMIMEPDFDGLDTLREIVKHCPDQKSLIVSGYSATERVQAALELGAGGYVKKPFTVEAIGAAVRKVLDKTVTEKAVSM